MDKIIKTSLNRLSYLGLNEEQSKLIINWIYNGTFNNSKENLINYKNAFLKLKSHLPQSLLDSLNEKIIFRGFLTNIDVEKEFRLGKNIVLKPSILSSWTTCSITAKQYACGSSSLTGVVMIAKCSEKDIAMGFTTEIINYLKLPSGLVENKGEIILLNNKTSISHEDVIELEIPKGTIYKNPSYKKIKSF